MKSKKGLWGLIGMVLALVLAGGCGPATPSDVVSPVNGADPAGALDSALDYLAQAYGDLAPAGDLTWQKQGIDTGGLLGAETATYTAGEWTAKVAYPIVAPENTVYTVTVTNKASGFSWQGEVDAALYVNALHPGVVAALRVALQAVESEQSVELPDLMSWTAAQTTPEGLVGRDDWLLQAGDWQAAISFPVVAPENVIYTVVLTNATSGFQWEGQVDATGNLMG